MIFRAVYRRRSQVASKFVERYHRDGRAVGRVCLEAGFVCMALSDKDIPYFLQSGKKHRLFSVTNAAHISNTDAVHISTHNSYLLQSSLG